MITFLNTGEKSLFGMQREVQVSSALAAARLEVHRRLTAWVVQHVSPIAIIVLIPISSNPCRRVSLVQSRLHERHAEYAVSKKSEVPGPGQSMIC